MDSRLLTKVGKQNRPPELAKEIGHHFRALGTWGFMFFSAPMNVQLAGFSCGYPGAWTFLPHELRSSSITKTTMNCVGETVGPSERGSNRSTCVWHHVAYRCHRSPRAATCSPSCLQHPGISPGARRRRPPHCQTSEEDMACPTLSNL